MKGILIIDHGSMKEEANHMLECVGELVQRMAGERVVVRVAHMELASPTIAEGFEACIAAGATEIVAFPYMLSPGKHSTRDIPRMVVRDCGGPSRSSGAGDDGVRRQRAACGGRAVASRCVAGGVRRSASMRAPGRRAASLLRRWMRGGGFGSRRPRGGEHRALASAARAGPPT